MARSHSLRPSDTRPLAKTIITILVLGILALGLYIVLTKPDERTLGQRFDQAVDDLNKGKSVEDAAETFERRTPGEKLGDAVEDAGQEIKENTGTR